MTTTKTVTTVAGALALGLASSLSAVEARELNFAIGHPPGAMLVQAAEKYADAVEKESGGELSVRVFPGSLLSMEETSAGLRDGMADIGTVMTTYFGAEYPHSNLILESSMMLQLLGDDVQGVEGIAYAAAMTEYLMLHCPECLDEFGRQNQVYTGGAGTPGYSLGCTSAVNDEASIQGKRLRIGGANWSRWANSVGASPVTLSGNEMLEALDQGALDCVILSTSDIANFRLDEALSDVTVAMPGGVYVGQLTQVNTGVWQSLSETHREAMLRAAAVGAAEGSMLYQQGEDRFIADAESNGITIHEADEGLQELTREFVREDLERIAANFAERHGVERSEAMLEEFRDVLETWVERVQGVDNAEALADLYWEHIMSQVDVASYGL
ncbi:C4-dicarboxylate TRAP transporter substrate-binding protein [Aquisalimonas sp. APHAB1-3]|uniref:C4-dicarboxylate TRAP transporter substrate-binding protein n=1 Tax=Aquisalimonas sp. APHAB1-3 TaxID=3402080 RepID=UPI003AAE7F4E